PMVARRLRPPPPQDELERPSNLCRDNLVYSYATEIRRPTPGKAQDSKRVCVGQRFSVNSALSGLRFDSAGVADGGRFFWPKYWGVAHIPLHLFAEPILESFILASLTNVIDKGGEFGTHLRLVQRQFSLYIDNHAPVECRLKIADLPNRSAE